MRSNEPWADKSGQETLLLVEDEDAIRNLVKSILEEHGYFILAAGKPREALRLAETYNGNIDLLITDVVMPEMNGHRLSEHLRTFYPDLRVIFISGYTADVIADHGIGDERIVLIQKPFSIETLTGKVREVLDRKSGV